MTEAATKPSGRKRGRPRTVTNDQEVPERRRKQLRLAQQAYRKRKENTIDNLENRVRELETGIEYLSHSFLSFSNLLLEGQLLSQHPHIASALQSITQQCVSLAKAGIDESEEPEEPTETQVYTKEPKSKPVRTPDDTSISDFKLDKSPSEASIEIEDMTRSVTQWGGPLTPPDQDPSFLPFGFISPPTTQLPYLTPPLSQSPQPLDLFPSNIAPKRQLSIAQLLLKACCQTGYRLLIDAPNHPTLQQIFGHMPSPSERNNMITKFYAAFHDGISDSFGLDPNVLTTLLANAHSFSADQPRLSPKMRQIALEATSGGWMDASGVERYLRDKRIIFETFTDSLGGSNYQVSSSLNLSTFLKYLSHEPVCIGNGPAFPRRCVEKAFSLAAVNALWDFDNMGDF